MKTLLALTAALSLTSTLASTYICSTSPSVTPNDIFIINVKDMATTTVKFQRYPFFGAEILPITRDIQGCNPAQVSVITADEVYIECDGDGDSGYIKLDTSSNTITGTVNFPEGNIGYQEDTSLEVVCHKQ